MPIFEMLRNSFQFPGRGPAIPNRYKKQLKQTRNIRTSITSTDSTYTLHLRLCIPFNHLTCQISPSHLLVKNTVLSSEKFTVRHTIKPNYKYFKHVYQDGILSITYLSKN